MNISGQVYINGIRGCNTCTFEGVERLWQALSSGNDLRLSNAMFLRTVQAQGTEAEATYAGLVGDPSNIIYYVGSAQPQASNGLELSYARLATGNGATITCRITVGDNVPANAYPIESCVLILNGNPAESINVTPSLAYSPTAAGTESIFCYYPTTGMMKLADAALTVTWIITVTF